MLKVNSLLALDCIWNKIEVFLPNFVYEFWKKNSQE